MSDHTLGHPAFRLISSTAVESLNLTVHHFEHQKTGAVHYHLESEHDEKAFMVALRTMPHDSTGVAHILEHTALCGSERYPVRDPFFMMTRRSLNTFMNAMTSSDWTAYPFASQNDKDFNNLLDVYLDAVFFSRLDPLDFAQEGHRVEFAEEGDTSSELEFKGVVFNEMKGAMSSPVSQLWQGISSYLFPTTTYHYNSGGEPADITDLSYDQLLEFYRSHYHPSNAIFMTFGDLDLAELQGKVNDQALAKFERQSRQWRVSPEKRYAAPISVEQRYGVDGDELTAKTHHVVGWLLGDSTDLDAQLEANLLSQILLDNSASPLRKALEQSELGGSPSPLCGLEDSNREMSFMCGVEGSEPEHAEAVEALILDTLKQVAEQGVERSLVDAALHQLELHQREIGGDHYPYGLQLIFNAIPAATHYGDPVSLLNLEPALARLKAKAAADDFVSNAIHTLLLNNRHRVRFTLRPDNEVNSETQRLERQRLDALLKSMNDADKQAVIDQAEALKQRQQQEDDPGLLPQVTLEDVKPEVSHIQPYAEHRAALDSTEYRAGTNGIIYQQLLLDLPALSHEQLTWLPFFTHAWTEVGAAEQDYLHQQHKQTSLVGSLTAYASIKGAVSDADQLQSYLVMTGKALGRNTQPFTELMQQTWREARFDESQRLLDLMTQVSARKEQGITGSGHSLAMSLASAPLSLAANAANDLGGMPQAKRLKQRLASAQVTPELIGTSLMELYQQIEAPQSALLVHDEAHAPGHVASLADVWARTETIRQASELQWQPQSSANFWMVDSQVNFCALAFPTVTLDHEDAAALAVVGGVLRNGYLHTAIRERGGAYGAGATQDSALACFKFYSYRDPRVEGTFDDFRQSINWLLEQPASPQLIEQSVLGIIGSMDRPGSPAGEAKQAFHMDKTGRTQAIRQCFRERLLAVSWHDVIRVTEQYLQNQDGMPGVIAPRGSQAVADALGMTVDEY